MAGNVTGAIKIAAKHHNLMVEEYLAKISVTKFCQKCKSWKPLENFGTDNSRGDKKKTKCFQCCRVITKVNTKGRISPFKGKTHTIEARHLIGQRGLNNQYRLGKFHTKESREKMSLSKRQSNSTKRGESHPRWKGGITSEYLKIRTSAEYLEWRNKIFERDNFTCQHCGDNRGGNLHAHHIKSFAEFPELRLEINNGLTLCSKCHELVHFKPNSLRNKRKVKNNVDWKQN